MTLDDIPQVVFGLSVCGLTGALLVKLLKVITRYNVLLAGHALDETDLHAAPTDSSISRSPPPFRYRLRIQSLEPTRTEYPIQVTIRGFPDGANIPSPEHHVWVAAGKKSIHVRRIFTKRPSQQDAADTSDPYVWQAVFPELPALDAWSFDVVMPCQRLEISIGFVGAEASKLLTPTFGPYFEPDHLTIFATDQGEPRIRGPITVPRPVVPLILSALTVLVYLLWRTFTNWHIDLSRLEWLDGALLGGALFFIWIGYSAIRRPVYPVISGYRFLTPPYPDADKSPDSPANHASHTEPNAAGQTD
jgi:hypothetical protein